MTQCVSASKHISIEHLSKMTILEIFHNCAPLYDCSKLYMKVPQLIG